MKPDGLGETFGTDMISKYCTFRRHRIAGRPAMAERVDPKHIGCPTSIFQIIDTNPAYMGAFFYLANFGTACFSIAGTSTVLRNFPAADRGKVRIEPERDLIGTICTV